MQLKPKGYWWDKDKCIEEALKYTKVSHFKKQSSGAYGGARRNGWLDECCSHMIRRNTKK
mgnify:FL=1